MRASILLTAVFFAAVSASAGTYEIDPVHSQVAFKIRHLVSKVSGRFTIFSGTIGYVPGKPEAWTVEAKIDPASINTDNEKRDAHLKSPDFFDVAKCPEMSFKSSKVGDVKGSSAKIYGVLTMHCTSKPVVLGLDVGGTGRDPFSGTERAGFSAKIKLDRKDFGIVWNKVLDDGGVLIGDEVEVSIEVEAPASK